MQFKLVEPKIFYQYDEKKKESYVQRVKNHILKNGTSLEKEMLKIVEKKVKHYQTDFFVHDLHTINNTEKTKYVWAVRETGTWLIILDYETKEEMEKMKNFFSYIIKDERHEMFLITNNTIKPLKTDEIKFSYKYKNFNDMFHQLTKDLKSNSYLKFFDEYKKNKDNIKTEKYILQLIKKVS